MKQDIRICFSMKVLFVFIHVIDLKPAYAIGKMSVNFVKVLVYFYASFNWWENSDNAFRLFIE